MSASDQERTEFILAGQQHCDHYLTPLANPTGKRVLVVGVGAGTEMLWCLSRGARFVHGVDIAPQDPAAIRAAAHACGLDIEDRFAIEQVAIEDAGHLEGQFELILSNNVFEHLPDVPGALAVCARLLDPTRGRLAIFTAPLFHSSAGSHLPLEPWEHLWGDAEEREARADYLFRQITLNRISLRDLLDAVAQNDLIIVNLRLHRDRELGTLPALRGRMPEVSATDLAIEGIAIELASFRSLEGEHDQPVVSTEEIVLANRWLESEAAHRTTVEGLEHRIADRDDLIARIEASPSFRLGRALTAPLRWLRDRNAGGT